MGVCNIGTLSIILIILALVIGVGAGFFIGVPIGIKRRMKTAEALFGSAEERAKTIVSDAQKAGDAKKRELMLEAKEENQKLRADFDKEVKERRNELNRQERRINQKEENLDKKTEALERKDAQLNKQLKNLEHKE